MTLKEAMLLIAEKTSRPAEAIKVLRAIESGSSSAEHRAINLIRIVLPETNGLTAADHKNLKSLLPDTLPAQNRTENIQFRCSPNEKAAIRLLASKYADGNISRLILGALEEKYQTL